MKKSMLTLSVAAVVSIGSLLPVVPSVLTVDASKIGELQQEQKEISNKKSTVDAKIKQAEGEIKKIQREQSSVKSEMKRLDLAISDAETKIAQKEREIANTKEEIKQLQAEIKELSRRIEVRNELLKERARALQENGNGISYLDVLFGAQSFSDFISRLGAISTIMEADKGIIEQHKKDQEDLQKKQVEVKNKLANLEKMLTDLQALKDSLSVQRAEKDSVMAELKQQEGEVRELKVSLEEERKILAAQEAAIKRTIERMKAEEAKKQNNNNNNNNNSGGNKGLPLPANSMFMQPAAGVLTSGYGPRWGTFHYGVDIAKPGNVPIYAAADGEVHYASYSSSYGNWVQITHYINGQVYTTVYAHMRNFIVSPGQVVKQGQVIGYMGNTGDSTGQHLHFELHKGPWKARNGINPAGIVPLP